MLNKVQLTWFIFRKQWLLKELGLENSDSYDNSSLSKPDKNNKFPESFIIDDVQLNDSLNTEGEGQISRYSIRQKEKKTIFL